MDDIDQLVRRAAPPALGSDATNASEARAIARSVAETRRPHRPRWRSGIGAAVLGLGLVGFGATAAVAGPELLQWVGWTPDTSVERTFELSGGTDIGLCEVAARIVPDYVGVSAAEAEERTEAARRFLASYDWAPIVAQITTEDIETATTMQSAARQAAIAAAEAAGTTPPPDADPGDIASSLMGDQIIRVLKDEGYFQAGVSVEMAGHCGSGSTGGTQ